MEFKHKKSYVAAMLALFGAIALGLILFFALYRYQGFGNALSELRAILSPFLYGSVIAYLLKPSVNFFAYYLEKYLPKKLHIIVTPLSILTSFAVTFASIYTLFALILPELVASISIVMRTTPQKMNEILEWLRESFANEPLIIEYINEWYTTISDSINTWLRETMMPYLTDIVSGVGLGVVNAVGLVADIFVGLFVAIYLLASRKKFAEQAKLALYSAVRSDWSDSILAELKYADKMFGGFINGKIVDSIIIGIISYIVCITVNFPNPTLISIIIGITNIIPFFGPFIGAVPTTILVFINEPIKAIWFIMFIIILQQLDGNVIGPKILGDSTGLSSFWVLFSILFFGGLWGFVGMIVGVPLFAVIYDITRSIIKRGLIRNGRTDLLVAYNRKFGNEPDPSIITEITDAMEDFIDVSDEIAKDAAAKEAAAQAVQTEEKPSFTQAESTQSQTSASPSTDESL